MRSSIGPAAGLVRLAFLVQGVYAEVGRTCELPVAQAQLLCTLIDRSLGMAELSGLLGVERSSATGLVDRAEHRGLVVREADPDDRRAVKVRLTPAGSDTVNRFHGHLTERLEDLLGGLSAAERDRFVRTLGRLVAEVPDVFADTGRPETRVVPGGPGQ